MKTCEEIAGIIKPLAETGTLLPRSSTNILNNLEDWIIKRDEYGNIIGFAEFRHHTPDTSEIGSMVSLQPGIGSCLLQSFEVRRKALGIAQGCAITKDISTAQNFFQAKTAGIITDFPSWFKREKDDRYFVSWPVKN